MSDLGLWLGFLVAACTGAAIAHFNPAIAYRRGTLIGLTVVAVLVIGAALMFGFFAPPTLSRSGVYNLNGG